MWIRLNRRRYWVRGCSGIYRYFLDDTKYCRFQKCPRKNPNQLSCLDVAAGDTFEELGEDGKPAWFIKITDEDGIEMLARKYTTLFAIDGLD